VEIRQRRKKKSYLRGLVMKKKFKGKYPKKYKKK